MITQSSSALNVAQDILVAGEDIQLRNVSASSHACYKMFTNGHAMGTIATTATATTTTTGLLGPTANNNGTTSTVLTNDDQYLLPDRGLLMSTGDPDTFCINDSDEQTKSWGTTGDMDLTRIARKNVGAELTSTFDAVSSSVVVRNRGGPISLVYHAIPHFVFRGDISLSPSLIVQKIYSRNPSCVFILSLQLTYYLSPRSITTTKSA